MYTADAINDIEKNARIQLIEMSLSNSEARALGKKINKFLTQCLGRINLM